MTEDEGTKSMSCSSAIAIVGPPSSLDESRMNHLQLRGYAWNGQNLIPPRRNHCYFVLPSILSCEQSLSEVPFPAVP